MAVTAILATAAGERRVLLGSSVSPGFPGDFFWLFAVLFTFLCIRSLFASGSSILLSTESFDRSAG